MKKILLFALCVASACLFCEVAVAQPAGAPWPMFQHDAQHTGRSTSLTGPTVPALLWTYATGAWIYNSPSIGSDGAVYVSSIFEIYSVSSHGTFLWSYGTRSISSPALAGSGDVYVGSDDSNLCVLNPEGRLRWSYDTGGQVATSPALAIDGSAYIGSMDRRIYAIDSLCALKWSYEAHEPISSSPALSSDGVVHTGSSDNYFYAINPDAALFWSYETGGDIFSSPMIDTDGSMYAGSYDNSLYCIGSNGLLKWSYSATVGLASCPALSNEGIVFSSYTDRIVYALNLYGALRWSYRTEAWPDSAITVGSDGTAYVGSGGNKLYAFNSSGLPKWIYTTGSCSPNSPSLAGAGSLCSGAGVGMGFGGGGGSGMILYFVEATPTTTPTMTPTPTPTCTFISTPPVGAYAYVTNTGSDAIPGTTVSRIDISTYDVRPITVGLRPMGIDITPDGGWVYVVNNDSDSVSVIQTGDVREIMQIPVGVEPIGIAIDNAGRYAYVTNSMETPDITNGTISVIDIANKAVVDTITVGKFPAWGIDVSNDGSKLAVANFNDNTVYLIDTSTRERIGVIERSDGFAPMDVKFGPGDERLYIAYFSDGTQDHVRSVDLVRGGPDLYYDQEGDGPASISFHPDGAWFITTNYFGNNLYNCNVESGDTGTRNVAPGPLRGAFTLDGGKFFAPCYLSSENKHEGEIEVSDCTGGSPVSIRKLAAGVNPSAIVIGNRTVRKKIAHRSGINLYAEPRIVKSSEGVYLKYALVMPEGRSLDAGVIMGGIVNDVYYYAFTEGFKDVVPVNPSRIGSFPKAVKSMSLTNGQSGSLRISGLPAGVLCRFFVALTDKNKGNLIHYSLSNSIVVE
ncbi:MAG: PQQ-binding-like beta-propeller repeat protein [Candidatus Aureabacteria bacterium]|nr:PQQ-binding-like beta-propeller repeat protein [Candidatus Auribacterota bacterium]